MWKSRATLLGLMVFILSSSALAEKKTKACDLVDVKVESFWKLMQWKKSCPADRASKYVIEIWPLKSKTMRTVFQKHQLPGGGPAVAALVETLVLRDKLFPLELDPTLVRLDDESEALRINSLSKKEMEISTQSILPALSAEARLESLIAEASKRGVLE